MLWLLWYSAWFSEKIQKPNGIFCIYKTTKLPEFIAEFGLEPISLLLKPFPSPHLYSPCIHCPKVNTVLTGAELLPALHEATLIPNSVAGIWTCISFLSLLWQNTTNLVTWNKTNLSSYRSRGFKFKISLIHLTQRCQQGCRRICFPHLASF